MILESKIYLLQSYERCYKCGGIADVFCIATEGLIEAESELIIDCFVTFSFLKNISENIKGVLKQHAPSYYQDYTKTTNSVYYLNHCKCGAKLGDHYLHNEHDGAFFPTSEENAKNSII